MKKTPSKQTLRPRNYLARHPLMKKGGVHKKSEKAHRKAAKQRLKNERDYEFPGENGLSVGTIFAREFGLNSLTVNRV